MDMKLLRVLIPLLISLRVWSLPDDLVFQQFLDTYYSDPRQPVLNVSDDQVLISVKPAPLPFPPDHPPVPPVIDITILEDQLYAVDGLAYQKFGQQIAAAGSVVAVSTNSAGPKSKVYLYEEHSMDSTNEGYVGYVATGSVSSPSAKQDGFGSSITISDDVLVVGAPQDNTGGFSSGKVYVMEAKGLHKTLQTLTASPPTPKGSQFGQSLSLFGSTLAVGAPGYSVGVNKGSGAVYVFEAKESTPMSFTQTSLILPPSTDLPPFGQFGSALQLQQDLLAVSAVADSSQVLNGGAVYLYTYTASASNTTSSELTSEGQWEPTQKLQPEGLPSYAYFGRSLAFRDNLGLVGAYNEQGSGVVYVFAREADSLWTLSAMLLPTDPSDSFNNFGSSLCLHQTSTTAEAGATQSVIAVVGSSGDSTNNEMAGAIYVFGVKDASSSSNGMSFLLLDKLTNSDSTAFNAYGTSVAATDSGHVLVGAPQADSSVSLTAGVVYVESNLIPYYLEVVGSVEETTDDDVSSGSSSSSLTKMVRDALLSTVGIVLLAVIPIVTVSGIVGIIALRGGFSKHRYQSAAQSVDAHGNLLDKSGNIIENESQKQPQQNLSGYAYFVNPLKRSKVVLKPGSMDLQSVSSEGSASSHRVTKSTDLDTLYAPVDIHSTIRSPLNSEHTIYPSPIAIPSRPIAVREVVMPCDEEESKC